MKLSNIFIIVGILFIITSFTNKLESTIPLLSLDGFDSVLTSSEDAQVLEHGSRRTITVSDGVYAITTDSVLVAYSDVTDTIYTGVVFVVNGKVYQLAKFDASYNEEISWNRNDNRDIVSLRNYGKADNERTIGAFRIPQVTYRHPTYLNDDWPVWLSYTDGALSDFNGRINTAIIMDAQQRGIIEGTISKTVKEFRENPTYNEGKQDWFLPSCGELCFMYIKSKELNHLLKKVSGKEFSKRNYLSSTESFPENIWSLNFLTGKLSSTEKTDLSHYNKVRLIRNYSAKLTVRVNGFIRLDEN